MSGTGYVDANGTSNFENASDTSKSITMSSFNSLHTQENILAVNAATPVISSAESLTTLARPTTRTIRSVTSRTSTHQGSAQSTRSTIMEAPHGIFYDSIAASVVGSPDWTLSSSSLGPADLPEIPSESGLNSPAGSLVTIGSSEGRIRRIASSSSALSSVPSDIPSISSWKSGESKPQAESVRHSSRRVSSQALAQLNTSPSIASIRTVNVLNADPPSPSLMPSAEQLFEDDFAALNRDLELEPLDNTLSLVSPLPRSVSQDGISVDTPTSLVISDSNSDETLSLSPGTHSSISLSPPLAKAEAWGSTTDLSYNSSVLHPSPSIPSVSFNEEDQDDIQSFDTSFLRPSTVSSTSPRILAMYTPPLRPPGPVPPSSTASSSPALQQLPTFTSAHKMIGTPSTQSLSSTSSTRISRPLPRVPISRATESLISASLLGSERQTEQERSPPRPISTPTSQSSLPHVFVSATPASRHDEPLIATTHRATSSSATPSGTMIVSLTTPQGSGSTGRPSLRTVSSELSAPTEDKNFNRLVGQLHSYNLTRGLEHQGLLNDVRELKNEVRGLAGLVRIGPSVATPAVLLVPPSNLAVRPHAGPSLTSEEYQSQIVALGKVDRSIGGVPTSKVTADIDLSPSSSTSPVTTAHSYLSSHHSDDDVLHLEEELLLPPIHSPVFPRDSTADLSLQESSDSDSSNLSSSPYVSSSELSEKWFATGTTQVDASSPHDIHVIPEIVSRALQGIQNQLRTLDDSQNANINRLESLQQERHPGEEDNRSEELLERLEHIENLLKAYLEMGQQQQATASSPVRSGRNGVNGVAVPPPLTRRESVMSTSQSDDSVHKLRRFLGEMSRHIDNDYDHSSQRNRMSMPPLSLSTARPSKPRLHVNDELDSSDPSPALRQTEIPIVEPFDYLFGDSVLGRGERPRSASPLSFDKLPPFPRTSSMMVPVPIPVSASHPPKRRKEQARGNPAKVQVNSAAPDAERLLTQKRIKRDMDALQRQNQSQRTGEQSQRRPSRQVVLRSALGPTNFAPPISGVQPPDLLTQSSRPRAIPADRTQNDSKGQLDPTIPSRTKSWYVRRDEQGGKRPIDPAVVDSSKVRYMPVSNAPLQVGMPSLVPSMNVLRDQRLAQVATVDQQRELMKYMKGLNEWLEADVRNRRAEFRDVFQTVADLRRQIKGMKRKGGTDRGRDKRDENRRGQSLRTRSERPETTIHSTTSVAPQQWTAVPALVQPFSVQAQSSQGQRVVVPSVLPESRIRGSSSQASFFPVMQPPLGAHRNQAGGQRGAQPMPTIILLPPTPGTNAPGQVPAYGNIRPVDRQLSGRREERVERSGTRRSRR